MFKGPLWFGCIGCQAAQKETKRCCKILCKLPMASKLDLIYTPTLKGGSEWQSAAPRVHELVPNVKDGN